MKKTIAIFLLLGSLVWADNIFNVPVVFDTGATVKITAGVPLQGTWDFSGATSVVGVPPPTISLTGSVTGTGTTSIATTVVTINDLVSLPGSIVSTNIAGPTAPPSGKTKWYTDQTDKRFHDRNDTGSTGTTVVARTPQPNYVVTGISTAGVITQALPTFPDSDPHVAGAGYWSGGILHRSLGTPTPTPTATATPTPTP